MRHLVKIGLSIAFSVFFVEAACFAEVNLDRVIDASKRLDLSSKKAWHKLMFYERSDFTKVVVESAVHSDGFFLSKNGKKSPGEELRATLEALFSPQSEDKNAHAQCKFRGRYEWLDQQLNLKSYGLNDVPCPDFEEWSLDGQTASVSIVFATGYLGNPASYYGHTLLKLNSRNNKGNTKLEDVTVNYGAIVPDNENPVSYILKGLFGGYDAGFSHIQYYFHNHNYGENELRDLWEYELDLNSDQLALVLGHAWEVISQKYQYYFTRKNCAYRMAEVLEVVDGIELIPNRRIWTVPQKIVQNAASSNLNGRPLVKSVLYHPSRQSRLYKRFSSLTKAEQQTVAKVALDTQVIEGKEFSKRGIASQQRILDTLLDYFQYIRDSKQLEKDIANSRYREVLAKRYKLPPGDTPLDFGNKNSPHKGRNPSLLSLGFAHNGAKGDGSVITLRPVYYDALDAGFGHVKNAQLSMGRIELEAFRGGLKLRELQIFSVESVKGQSTGLPGDKGDSWKLGFGVDRQTLGCSNCLVPYLRGDLGNTWLARENLVLGAYIGGSIQQDRNQFGNIFGRCSLVANLDISESFRMGLYSEYRQFVDGSSNGHWVHKAQGRWSITTNTDLRISYSYNDVSESSIAFSWFW